MSTNISRHQAGTTVAGEKTGGQFKAGKRSEAGGAVLDEQFDPAHPRKMRSDRITTYWECGDDMEIGDTVSLTAVADTPLQEQVARDIAGLFTYSTVEKDSEGSLVVVRDPEDPDVYVISVDKEGSTSSTTVTVDDFDRDQEETLREADWSTGYSA